MEHNSVIQIFYLKKHSLVGAGGVRNYLWATKQSTAKFVNLGGLSVYELALCCLEVALWGL